MKKKPQLLPRHLRQFEALGENLKLARLRRNLTAEMVAQRAGISRMTLNKIVMDNQLFSKNRASKLKLTL